MAVVLGCGWLVWGQSVPQAVDPVREAMERGLVAEETGKDLAGAAKAYAEAVAAADARRVNLATALFRWAEVERRLGRTNEATALYRRVLVEFPDQPELVGAARRHVGSPEETGNRADPRQVARLVQALNEELLTMEQVLAETAQKREQLRRLRDDEDRLKWMAREVPTSMARSLLERVSQAQQDLAQQKAKVGENHPDLVRMKSLMELLEVQAQRELASYTTALDTEIELRQERAKALAAQIQDLSRSSGGNGLGVVGTGSPGTTDADRLLDDEIRVAEQQLLIQQKKLEAGRAGEEDVLKARREVLSLQRQRAEKRQRRDLLDVVPAGGASSVERTASPSAKPDEEEAELARLKGLLQNSPDLLGESGSEGTPLEKAVRRGHARVLAFLLGDGMPTRSENSLRSGLRAGSIAGRVEACRLLLDAGADPNREDPGGGLPLLRAAYAGHRAVVELLLDRGAKVDGGLTTPTADISSGRHLPSGTTALHVAAMAKRLTIVELLLQRGASPDGLDSSGGTALSMAMTWSWEEGARRLLEAGADPDLGNALHIACARMPSMIRPLLEAGADPNRISEKSDDRSSLVGSLMTPLRVAASAKLPVDGITALLDAGAFANPGDSMGLTPLDFAPSREAGALLRSRGGRSTAFASQSDASPRRTVAVVSGALAGVVGWRIAGTNQVDGARGPGEGLPRRLSQLLQEILLIETNTPGLAPDLTRVVVTRTVAAEKAVAAPPGVEYSANIKPYAMVRDRVTGQMRPELAGPMTLSTTNDVAAILASGDASRDLEIADDGLTFIFVPFKPRPKMERRVSRPATVVAAKGVGLVTVLGGVERPGNLEVGPGKVMDLVQVIAGAGGLSREGDPRRILLRRGTETKVLDLDKAMSDRVPMEPGDIIEVRKRVF